VHNDDSPAPPRTLADATVLQIVPALREEPVARTALNVAAALVQSGARALVAGEEGPLVGELTAFGGEWAPLVNATLNPFKLRRSARIVERLIASEHVDIVHAQSVGGAWIASMAARRIQVLLVTTLLDVPASGLRGYWAGALARGDWVITPSNFAAAPVTARHKIPPERVTIIPRSIDVAAFDPAAVDAARVEALRNAWRISPTARILLVPGRVAPWNGQLILPEVARILLDSGVSGFVFVLAGEHRSYRKYARAVAKEAEVKGVQAQAMGRPVVTSDVGILPEHVAAPPEMPEEVRTGWVAKAGDAGEFAHALSEAFALDEIAYRTMAERARHFADYMFSPRNAVAATHAVYGALLARSLPDGGERVGSAAKRTEGR